MSTCIFNLVYHRVLMREEDWWNSNSETVPGLISQVVWFCRWTATVIECKVRFFEGCLKVWLAQDLLLVDIYYCQWGGNMQCWNGWSLCIIRVVIPLYSGNRPSVIQWNLSFSISTLIPFPPSYKPQFLNILHFLNIPAGLDISSYSIINGTSTSGFCNVSEYHQLV